MECQCRHVAYMEEFTADIQHVAGQENVAADALSRPPVFSNTVAAVSLDVVTDLCGNADCQSSCPSTLQARKSPSLQVKACEVEGVSILCNVSTEN